MPRAGFDPNQAAPDGGGGLAQGPLIGGLFSPGQTPSNAPPSADTPAASPDPYPGAPPTAPRPPEPLGVIGLGGGTPAPVPVTRVYAVGLLLDESERSRMRRRAEELSFANGAQEAADEIARLASSAERARTASIDGLLQLSSATAAELASVEGIGPVTAKRIIEIRDRAGLSSLEELARVRGIGPATLTALRARLQAER